MKTKQFTTVSVGQVLEDCPHAIACFNEGDFSVSFGDAVATLVDQEMFLGMLSDAGLVKPDDEVDTEQTPIDFEMKKVYDRLDGLGDSILIDLGS